MIKVNECRGYNPEFPERFRWPAVDNIGLATVATVIADKIMTDLEEPTDGRLLTPGMRESLRVIAVMADVDQLWIPSNSRS